MANGKLGRPRAFIFAPRMRKETKFLSKAKGFISEGKNPERREGFTLVELMVVISIIMILATIVTASFGKAQEKARDGRRQVDLSSLRNALELYYSENSRYITTTGDAWANAGTALTGLTAPVVYIQLIPSDPKPGWSSYRYRSVSGGQGYCLAANLEGTAPPSTCTVSLETPTYDYGVGNP